MNETGTAIDLERVHEIASEIAERNAESIPIEWESVGLVGDPATRMVEHATFHDARFIVLGGRKRSPTGKALFGSVTQLIVMDAECPTVMTVVE